MALLSCARSQVGTLVLIAVMGAGCVSPVFNGAFTLSTSAAATKNLERLGRVSTEQCSYLILLLPIPVDPRDIYDDLLRKAVAKGGNAVVDFELRSSPSFSFIPLFMKTCLEAVGDAARVEPG
jgi:hypothetical protein